MFNVSTVDTIVWDFDGVLNRNFVDGKYTWNFSFEDEFGHSVETFNEIVFNDKFSEILTGEMSLLDSVSDWASTVGYNGDLLNLIEFWFQNDYNLDDRVLTMLSASKRSNLRNVLGTNNEAMRTQFIAEDLGFADRMDRIFASGLMGVAKPDEAFFDMVSDELAVEPDEMMLIDDSAENIEAADASGWQVHWFDGQDYDSLEAKLKEVGALG